MRNLPLFTILSLAVGCGGSFAPETGRWATTDFNTVSNTCPTDDDDDGDEIDDGEIFLFFNEETEAYSIGFEANASAEAQIACTLDGRDMSCGPIVSMIDLTPDVDFNMTITQNVSVKFNNETSFDGSLAASTTCVGEACEEGYPCATEFSFKGSR